MYAVIMAGGRGTRIASVNSEVPKPMIPIAGRPNLEYEIEELRKNGITDIFLIVGYLGDVIKEHFGDGSRFGVSISYVTEDTPLGTAGALYLIKDQIRDKSGNETDFILLNGDIIFSIDVGRLLRAHKENVRSGAVVTILTHPNSHPYDSGIIISDDKGKVTGWLTKEDERLWYKNRVNAGIHVINTRIFDDPAGSGIYKELRKLDLDRDVLKPLIPKGLLYCLDSPEYIKDMGTPDRYYQTEQDIISGRVAARNLERKQRAVFLDRDGTINKEVGFLKNIDDLELLPGAADAIRKINEAGWLAIVVTNQPVIARGEVSPEYLAEIHNKLETLLGMEGAYLDAIYFCPHHPHGGYDGEVPGLKIECECRKPKPGMLLKASIDYNIDLAGSWMVGDSFRDIGAGKAAGTKTVLISEGDTPEDMGQTDTVRSLKEFADRYICGMEGQTIGEK